MNERDRTNPVYNGHNIDWFNWNNYMPEMVCRCAKIAIQNGNKYFGVQYWGK